MRAVVTGCAGFIGSHLSEALLAAGHSVSGIDCFTAYYGRELKEANLTKLRATPGFEFRELDLSADELRPALEGAEVVFHLAAYPDSSRVSPSSTCTSGTTSPPRTGSSKRCGARSRCGR